MKAKVSKPRTVKIEILASGEARDPHMPAKLALKFATLLLTERATSLVGLRDAVLTLILRAIKARDAGFFRYIAGRLEAKGEPDALPHPVRSTLGIWIYEGKIDLNRTYTAAELGDMLRAFLKPSPDPTHITREARSLGIKVNSKRGRPRKKCCGKF